MNNVSFMKLTAAPTSLDRATPSVALKPSVDRTLLTPALQQPVQRDSREAVRKLSHQLEAVFVNQLFQAMRASVPKDPILGNAPGAEMFTQIMDEKLASQASDHLQRGLGENLYRQLARRLAETPEGSAK